jgi:hypothetical protein
VIPETRRQIEQAGFRVEDRQIKPAKALPEPKSKALTKKEKEKIEKQVAELEVEVLADTDPVNEYVPEVFNEVDQVFSELKDMPEPDRFEKLIEFEVRGWLIPREHKAWMKYFEQTNGYERHQKYFEEHRSKMAVVYGSEITGTVD